MYIIISGNVVDGLAHWGPFEDEERAHKWAFYDLRGVDWSVVELERPDEDDVPTLPTVNAPEADEKPRPEDFCPDLESPEHRHEVDPGSYTVESDAESVYLDVNCRHCGRSGCAGRIPTDGSAVVDW